MDGNINIKSIKEHDDKHILILFSILVAFMYKNKFDIIT